jgi:hypothetical protein
MRTYRLMRPLLWPSALNSSTRLNQPAGSNMIEIEFSALARLCLNRRIPTIEQLEAEIMAIIAERNQKRIKINWQFSLADCRQKLNARYSVVNEANSKFKEVVVI